MDKDSFIFGRDLAPQWFLDKVNDEIVHYIRAKDEHNHIVGCAFATVNGLTKEIKLYEEIHKSDLLTKEEMQDG